MREEKMLNENVGEKGWWRMRIIEMMEILSLSLFDSFFHSNTWSRLSPHPELTLDSTTFFLSLLLILFFPHSLFPNLILLKREAREKEQCWRGRQRIERKKEEKKIFLKPLLEVSSCLFRSCFTFPPLLSFPLPVLSFSVFLTFLVLTIYIFSPFFVLHFSLNFSFQQFFLIFCNNFFSSFATMIAGLGFDSFEH